MKVVILGSTGMLGQAVATAFARAGISTINISRSGDYPWDASSNNLPELLAKLAVSDADFLVNCIGWIPQKATGDAIEDERQALNLNSELPKQISIAQDIYRFRWLQIGTDCVFNGVGGPSNENSTQNATDLYGRTKIAGERYSSGAILLRSSIVGSDSIGASGLFEWFRGREHGASVQGYVNHFWNGVTTDVFAKVALGLFRSYFGAPFIQHFIPFGSVSKFELLSLFARMLQRGDLQIEPIEHESTLDRRLSTLNSQRNDWLWSLAGYSRPQTIEEMVNAISIRASRSDA